MVNKLNSKGFTLLELIIVLALVGMVISSIFSFLLFNMRTFNRGTDQVQAQHEAQMLMDKVIDNIIETEEKTSNGNYKVSSSDFVRFKRDGTDVKMKIGADDLTNPTNVIGRNITDFTISHITNKKITINIKSTINDTSVILENELFLRNAN